MKKSQPLVSVIIPTYNRAHLLCEAIDSVLAQSFKEHEIVIVDDGSTDDTPGVAGGYLPSVRYFRQENLGPAAARNNGIRNAGGKLIAFLDSDDLWHPEKLAEQVRLFSENPALGIAATGYEVVDDRSRILSVDLLSSADLRAIRTKNHYRNFIATPTVMVRAECLAMVGLFNEKLRFAEDWEMWLRVMARYPFQYLAKPLVKVRVHPVRITTLSVEKNIQDWTEVIDRCCTGDTPLQKIFLRRKRISWLRLNQAFVERGRSLQGERKFLLQSIISWPLWLPRRYSSLLKTFLRTNPGIS